MLTLSLGFQSRVPIAVYTTCNRNHAWQIHELQITVKGPATVKRCLGAAYTGCWPELSFHENA